MANKKLAAEARLYAVLRKSESLTEEEQSILATLENIEGVKVTAEASGKSKAADQAAEIAAAVAALTKADIFVLDLETIGTTGEEDAALDPLTNRIEGVGVGVGKGKKDAWWFPFIPSHPGEQVYSQVQVFRALEPILKDPNKFLLNSNPKFDIKCLKVQGIDVENKIIDTVIADWLLDENQKRHGLKEIIEREYGIKTVSWAEAKKAAAVPGSEGAFREYALNDVKFAFMAWDKLEKRLKKEPKLLKLFYEVEMELIPIFVELELDGVRVDRDYLDHPDPDFSNDPTKGTGLLQILNKEKAEAEVRAKAALGRDIDVSKSQQVSAALFGIPSTEALRKAEINEKIIAKMSEDSTFFVSPPGLFPIPLDKKRQPILPGKTGYYSTDDGILSYLAGHPFIDAVLDWRWADKMLSTYVVSYLEKSIRDGKVHPDFNLAGAKTGRFTCSGPNLQQIPAEKGKYSVKKSFIPDPDTVFICGDFGQIQFKIAGHLAKKILGKSAIADAYLAGSDLHTKTQTELHFADRKPAKTVNFGFIFGRMPDGFSYDNHIPIDDAKKFYNHFHRAYPELDQMYDWVKEELCEKGYVSSLTGRKRRFPKYKGMDPYKDGGKLWWDSRSTAWNAMVQGGEADVVRISMRNIHRAIRAKRKVDPRWERVKLKAQVHDEMLYQAPKEIAEEVAAIVKKEAESCLKLVVPITFDIGISANNWEEAKK